MNCHKFTEGEDHEKTNINYFYNTNNSSRAVFVSCLILLAWLHKYFRWRFTHLYSSKNNHDYRTDSCLYLIVTCLHPFYQAQVKKVPSVRLLLKGIRNILGSRILGCSLGSQF